jgi:signal transduction histidine kinase
MTQRRKVLIIDDEAGPRESLRYLLKEAYDVFCASSVDAGIEHLRRNAPDLIVMDIRMPGKTGIEGLREIRKIDPLVSVVMLTGFGALETAQEALRLGATDYLNKPFDTGEMREIVRRYTERTLLERRRTDMLHELQDVNRRLVDDLTDRERLRKISDSTAEFAHDLRNPLTIVGGYVDLLSRKIEESRDKMGDTYEQAIDYLDVIGENVKRCCELSQLWQEFQKGGAPRFEPTPIVEIFDNLRKSIEPLADTVNVRVEYTVENRDVLVFGIRAQLIRAFHNVVANAIQAVNPRDGKVRVTCRKTADRLEIVVEDNGCGMTPEVRNRLFEPYFTTKPEGEGTGLGMVITRKIVEEHQGSIDVQTSPGFGSIFTIALPLHPAGNAALSN